jgi:hypothetical protein
MVFTPIIGYSGPFLHLQDHEWYWKTRLVLAINADILKLAEGK